MHLSDHLFSHPGIPYLTTLVDDKVLQDFRLLPLAVVALTTGIQILYIAFYWIRYRSSKPGPENTASEQIRSFRLVNHINRSGGYAIFALRVIRLIATATLLFLSVATLSKCAEEQLNTEAIVRNCHEYGLTASLLYAALAAVVLVASESWGSFAGGLNIVILLTVLGVYTYRDIYPLATYTQEPADLHEGPIIWIKIVTLIVAAIFIPLFSPRHYVPLDPKNPMIVLNDEQTASWISRFTFSYINPIISLASKVPHLSYDQLPPIIDDDRAKYQTGRAFLFIEPSRATKEHIFFAFIRHFGREYFVYGLTLAVSCAMSFVSPIGIKQTLKYLETGGKGSSVRPWVWISLLLLGPLLAALSDRWSLFLIGKMRARFQAVVTQVVFEHSLRIRLKAGSADRKTDETTTSLDTASDVQLENQAGADLSNTEPEAITTTDDQQIAETLAASTKDKNSGNKADNLIGRINNLVTSDQDNMSEGADFLNLVFRVPFQIALCLVFLYQILGWSAFVGLTSMIALMPLAGYVGKKMQDVQVSQMKMTDARVQKMSEAVNVLRMIKLFGWEQKMGKRLYQSREDELRWVWKTKVLAICSVLISYTAPMLSMLLAYGTYTVIMRKALTASTIFSSLAVFQILIEQLNRVSWQTKLIIDGKVSLDRLNDFLQDTEVLDHFSTDNNQQLRPVRVDDVPADKFGFRNATFAWSAVQDVSLTPTTREFKLHIEEEILFKRNCINLIIGPTGCGKTSMLMALLGEMHFMPSSTESWYDLPRSGGVAYAAQESWVQNATIRENILFETPYDEERYQQVLQQCALEPDLKLFEAGDQTEVGERGLTLSGGQKARVTLARAIYSTAQIILLDDVLAALDVHTSSWIVNQCFRGDLVKGRTILLVTHNVALVGPLAQFVVSIGLDGGIRSQGTDIETAISKDHVLASEVIHDKESAEKEADQTPAAPVPAGKLTVPEEIAQGHITWKSMKLLLLGLGGDHPIFFVVAIYSALIAQCLFHAGQPWFLGIWGAQYETHHPSEVSLPFYLTGFAAMLLGNMTMFALANVFFFYRSIGASRTIHDKLIKSVFGSTFRWLDQTPTSRILARCTQDIRTIDTRIAQSLMWVISQSLGALFKLCIVAYLTPASFFPAVGIGLLGIWIGNLYLKAQLSVKRELSNARSPMLAHFSAAIHGLVSLRAYSAQDSFKIESYKRIDHYTRTARISYDLNRWIEVRIDALGAFFTAGLATYLVYGPPGTSASNTGFSLNLAVYFCLNIFWLIRIFNELEVESNSLERIQDYIDIEHESSPTERGTPPASWPTSGALRAENLNARYSPSGPKVLSNLSFDIASGERVGVVGRTGSGKSTLTLALLRCILTEGTIYYDGISIDDVNLDILRANITIIPQTPELLSGTLRENLDPLGENDDATLNSALQSSGLLSLQRDREVFTLDTHISGGGSNLSVGQRQIVSLARAIVRRSKLLILDEATSAVDYKTDAVIQRTLRTEIAPDVTVITIAHRLQTIMDVDRIMVLDSGSIVEFDSPKNLLKKEGGILRALVEGSGEKENLVASVESV